MVVLTHVEPQARFVVAEKTELPHTLKEEEVYFSGIIKNCSRKCFLPKLKISIET